MRKLKLKAKLKMYESYLTQEEPKDQVEPKQNIEIPHLEKWASFDTSPYFLDNEYCLIRKKRYPIHTKRGKYTFNDFKTAVSAWQKTNIEHPLSTKGFQPTDLFFFDTETTGLGGGVGNTIFLLGYAYFENDEVVVKQHLLPEPGGEIPLYDSFLKSIDYTTLVTYNGKAFDWPQVKTRHTLVREHVPKLPQFGHFDLLHASRRLWKGELESVKLSIVEKEILGIEREDDVPGFLAPMIYFDFVETKNVDGIMKIMEHNEDDVLSLIALYTHISFQLLGLDREQSKTEQIQVGKWFSSLNQSKQAIKLYEQALDNFDGKESWQAKYDLAMQYKKQKQIEHSLPLWKEIIDEGRGIVKVKSTIELAKYLEHKRKSFQDAINVAREGLYELKRIKKISNTFPENLQEDLQKRIGRLQEKIQKKSYNSSLD
ncbi:ribonuclease H-like domain-containing protein [Pallidibacillus pasinlerensis]